MINPMSIRLENLKVERQSPYCAGPPVSVFVQNFLDSQFIHQTWASERACYLAERKGKKERPRARITAPSSLMANWQYKFVVGLLVAISIKFEYPKILDVLLKRRNITKQLHVFCRAMDPPDAADSINWTIEFREMNYSEEGSGNSSDFDPSRCGHVDEYYHQVRKDLAEPSLRFLHSSRTFNLV